MQWDFAVELLTRELPDLEGKLPLSPASSKAIPPFPVKFQAGIQSPFLLPSGGLEAHPALVPGVWSGPTVEWSPPADVTLPTTSVCSSSTSLPLPSAGFRVSRFPTFFCGSFLPFVQSAAQKFNLAAGLEQMESPGPAPQIPGTPARCRGQDFQPLTAWICQGRAQRNHFL